MFSAFASIEILNYLYVVVFYIIALISTIKYHIIKLRMFDQTS